MVKSTPRLYEVDPYKHSFKARIVNAIGRGVYRAAIILNETYFLPGGCGQRCDKGIIASPNGRLIVDEVYSEKGIIYHVGKFEGRMFPGDHVDCRIFWPRREGTLRVNTGGILIYVALKNILGDTISFDKIIIDGDYRGRLSIKGVVGKDVIREIEHYVNKFIEEKMEIKTSTISRLDEGLERGLSKRDIESFVEYFTHRFKIKPSDLRSIEISGTIIPQYVITFKNSGEVGRINITNIKKRLFSRDTIISYTLKPTVVTHSK